MSETVGRTWTAGGAARRARWRSSAQPRGSLQNRFFEAPSHLAGKRIEVRFDPLDLTQLEIYSEGKPEGRARLVDAVVNGLLPPWETEEK